MRPLRTTTSQQVAMPSVGIAFEITSSDWSQSSRYDEIEFDALPTINAPSGAKRAANGVAPALALATILDRLPFGYTRKTSILLVAVSVTTRNLPLGLKASDVGEVAVSLNPLVEFAIGCRCPSPDILKPLTFPFPPAFST